MPKKRKRGYLHHKKKKRISAAGFAGERPMRIFFEGGVGGALSEGEGIP